MSKDPAYPMYAQDFDMDTAAWGTDEIGIYVRLLNYEWVNGSIPDDIQRIAKIVRVSPRKLQKSWEIISKKFAKNGDNNLQNRRMEEEREKRLNYIESQREKGILSAKKRWGGVTTVKPGLQPNDKPEGNSSSSSSLTTLKGSSQQPSVAPCPHQKIIDLYHEILPELQAVKIWSEPRKKTLQRKWREDPKRQNLDYWKRLFEYVRGSPFLMGENDRQWTCDLEWIIKPKNFVKIIEGKYHKGGENG